MGGTVLILYQIVAYVYFFVSVSLVYSKTRKIVKMPGLSFFWAISTLYSTVLFYPVTLSYFSFMAPSDAEGDGHINSYDQTIFAYKSTPRIIISVIVMIFWGLMLIVQVLNTLFTSEISMQRLVTWSSVEPYTRLLLTLVKIYQAVTITFVVSFAVTTKDIPPLVEIIIIGVLNLCIALIRLGNPISTVRRVHFIDCFCDVFHLVVCVYALTALKWEEVPCILPIALIFAAAISMLYIYWINNSLHNLLTLPYIVNLKNPTDAYTYMSGVGVLLGSNDESTRGLLAGIVLNHNRVCENITCWCQDVKNAMSSRGKDPGHHGELKDTPPLNIETEKEVDYQNKSKIGRWMLSLQSDIMSAQNNALMNILVAYIYYFYIGNTYQSLNFLETAETFKPTFLESFAIYIHKRRIEAAIILSHELNLLEGSMPIDITTVLDFSDTYNRFLEIIQDCADSYKQFWNELNRDVPDSAKISNIGREISAKWSDIKRLFNRLFALMPKNMNYLYLFGLFIKYIMNDSEEAKKIYQKLVYIKNSKSHLKGPEYEKFLDENKAMMFLVSGARDSIGKIKEANIEAEKVLGYKRKELKGSKISRFMCSVIAEVHDKFIFKFYETLISNKVNHTFFHYIQEKYGYFIPIQMLIRIVPNLTEGLEFCCLCYRNESNPYVSSKINKTRNKVGTIICDENFHVLGVTKNSLRMLKFPEPLVRKGFPDSFVTTAFPILNNEDARIKLMENRGRIVDYKASRIQSLELESDDKSQSIKKDEEIFIWMRLVKQDYCDSKAVLILIVIDQVPNIDAPNYIQYNENGCEFFMNPKEGTGIKILSILPQVFKMNSEMDNKAQGINKGPFDYAESVFAESMLESLPSTASQSSSSIGTLTKDLTTFKEKVSEGDDPASVKRLRYILILFVIFIIGIVSKCFG